MNPQMHFGRSVGDQVKEQTIPGHINPDPSILMGGVSNNNLQQQHHGFMAHQVNFGAPTSSNVYYPVAPPAAPRVPAVPINYGSSDHLLSSYNNMPVFGGSSEEFARNHFKESIGSSYKRKNADTSVGSSHCSSPYESTSASVNAPIDTGHVYYRHPPQYGGGNRFLSIANDSNNRSVSVRSGAAGINLIHPSNYDGFIRGSLGPQSLQPASAFPFDQTLVGNPVLGNTGCLAWNHSPVIPYMHAGNINRVPLEVSMGMVGSAEIDREGRTVSFPHLVHASHGDHNLQHLPQTQGMRDHCFQFCPQVPGPHFPLPSRAIHIPVSSPVGPRPRGSSRQIRIGTNQPQTRGIPETMQIHCDIPYRYIDEVAIIDLPDHYDVRHHTDHHSDMRMDIEHMSYEELLALGERIGNVNTGLSEESITRQLRTRRYELPSTFADAKDSRSLDAETFGCIICLGDYQDQEELGCLDCGHDYHADCLKKWMLVKNVCPICKTQALPS